MFGDHVTVGLTAYNCGPYNLQNNGYAEKVLAAYEQIKTYADRETWSRNKRLAHWDEQAHGVQPVKEILKGDNERRFRTEFKGLWPLVYLVSEPEEKKLKWTDLKIGDVIHEKDGTETRMITGIDTRDEVDDDCNISHICASGWWCTDEILKNWEKVE